MNKKKKKIKFKVLFVKRNRNEIDCDNKRNSMQTFNK